MLQGSCLTYQRSVRDAFQIFDGAFIRQLILQAWRCLVLDMRFVTVLGLRFSPVYERAVQQCGPITQVPESSYVKQCCLLSRHSRR